MADLKSTALLTSLGNVLASSSETDRKAQIKKTNGIFQLEITGGSVPKIWTIDLKKTGTVTEGPAKPKADVTIILSDGTFSDLASGKLNGQKAFMTGKLKTKGNMMLATKLDGVLKTAKAKL